MPDLLLPPKSFIIFDSYKEVKAALPYLKEEIGDYIDEIKPEVGGSILSDGDWNFWPRYIIMKNDVGDVLYKYERYGGFDHAVSYKKPRFLLPSRPLKGYGLLRIEDYEAFYIKKDNYLDMSKVMKIHIALNL